MRCHRALHWSVSTPPITDDLKAGDVGPPHLVRRGRPVTELIGGLDHDQGRGGNQVMRFEAPANRGFGYQQGAAASFYYRTRGDDPTYLDRAAPRLPAAKLRSFTVIFGLFIEPVPGSNCPGGICLGWSAFDSRLLGFCRAFVFARSRALALVIFPSRFYIASLKVWCRVWGGAAGQRQISDHPSRRAPRSDRQNLIENADLGEPSPGEGQGTTEGNAGDVKHKMRDAEPEICRGRRNGRRV